MVPGSKSRNGAVGNLNMTLDVYKPGYVPLDIVDPSLVNPVSQFTDGDVELQSKEDPMASTDWKPPESWQVQEDVVLDERVTYAEMFASIPEFKANASWEQIGMDLVKRLEQRQIEGRMSFIRVFTLDESQNNFITLAVRPTITAYALLVAACKRRHIDVVSGYELELYVAGIGRVLENFEFPILLQQFLLTKLGYSEDDLETQGHEDNSFIFQFRLRQMSMQALQDLGPVPSWLKVDARGRRNANLKHRDLSSFPVSMFKVAPLINCLDISRNTRLQTFPFDLVQLLAPHLSQLKMRGNSLSSCPAHLSQLWNLVTVDFSRNRLGEFPSELASLPRLRELILDNNLLSNIPESLSKSRSSDCWKALRVLKLSNNAFRAFPSFKEPLDCLELLDLSFCGMEGTIGNTLFALRRLRVLRVVGNKLSGELPPSIKECTSLQILDLRLNKFGLNVDSDTIMEKPFLFDVVMHLPQLCILHLGDNPNPHLNFNAEQVALATVSDRRAKALNTITVSNCYVGKHFGPTNHTSIASLWLPETLTTLDLSHCSLAGLPANIGESLPLLKNLNLSDNKLLSLESFIFMVSVNESEFRVSLPQLEVLYAHHNCIAELPEKPWKHLSCLRETNLSYNALSAIPKSIWYCCNLTKLNLSCNMLRSFPVPPSEENGGYSESPLRLKETKVPDSAARLQTAEDSAPMAPKLDSRKLSWSLEELYLADNQLGDDFFAVLHHLPSLRTLNIAFNHITDLSSWLMSTSYIGQSPTSVLRMSFESGSVRDDDFYDEPASFRKPWYAELRHLVLSGNMIAFIPGEVERFQQLEDFFIAANRLGTVPGEVSKLSNLSTFDLSSQLGARGEGTGLRYNIANLPYDWNWSWNTKLNYLNFSGNKRLEIRPLGLDNDLRRNRESRREEQDIIFMSELNQATSNLGQHAIQSGNAEGYASGVVAVRQNATGASQTAHSHNPLAAQLSVDVSRMPFNANPSRNHQSISPFKTSESGAIEAAGRRPVKVSQTAPAIPLTLFRRATDGLLPLTLQHMIRNRQESSGISGVLDEEASKNFQTLEQLRLLGLMDVTCLVTLPDEQTQRRVRTTGSDFLLAGTQEGQLKYAIADTLGSLPEVSPGAPLEKHVALFDLVMPRFRGNDNEALFGLFDGRGSLFGAAAAKYCFDNFEVLFSNELRKAEQKLSSASEHSIYPVGLGEANIRKVFTRTFIAVHKEVCNLLSSRGSVQKSSNLATSDRHVGLFGCTATVAYLYGYTRVVPGEAPVDKCSLFVANLGDGMVVLSRSQGLAAVPSELHDPRICHGNDDLSRIRVSNGAVDYQLLLEGHLNISRGIGFPEMTPFVSPEPNIQRIDLKMEGELLVVDEVSEIEHTAESGQTFPAVKRPSLSDALASAGQTKSTSTMITRNECDEFIVMTNAAVWESFVTGRCQSDYSTAGQRIVDLVRSALNGSSVATEIQLLAGLTEHTEKGSNKPASVTFSGAMYGWNTAAIKVRDVAMSMSTSKSAQIARSKGHSGYMVMLIGLRNLTKKSQWWRNLRRGSGPSSSISPIVHPTPPIASLSSAVQVGLVSDANMALKPEAIAPPVGQLALVFTDIKGSTTLWESRHNAMRHGLRMHHALMRQLMLETGGYEVKTEGDAFMVSFADPLAALEWCLAVQSRLLDLSWQEELLETNEAGVVYYYNHQGRPIYCTYPPNPQNTKEGLLYRGICVRMGIHYGFPLCETDLVTQRMDYFGPMVNRAARTCGASMGGQILVTGDMWRKIMDIATRSAVSNVYGRRSVASHSFISSRPVSVFSQGKSFAELFPDGFSSKKHAREAERLNKLKLTAHFLGQVKLKGLEAPEMLFEVFPEHLAQRAAYLSAVKGESPLVLKTEPSIDIETSDMERLSMLCDRLGQFVVLDFFSAVKFESDSLSLKGAELSENDKGYQLQNLIKKLEIIEAKLYA